MNETLLLTEDELCDLTGYKRAATQARWLKDQRIPYLVGGDGKLKVLRQVIIVLLGGKKDMVPRQEPQLHLKKMKLA